MVRLATAGDYMAKLTVPLLFRNFSIDFQE